MGIFSFFSNMFSGNKTTGPCVDYGNNPEQLTREDVLNACEAVGAFKPFNDERRFRVCEDIANIYNNGPKTRAALESSYLEGFNMNGVKPDATAHVYSSFFVED